MFGHAVQFNFNRNGETHNTLIGGFLSMFVKLALGIYIYTKVSNLIMMKDAAVETKIKSLDVIHLPEVSWESSNTALFWTMRITKDEEKPFFLDYENLD